MENLVIENIISLHIYSPKSQKWVSKAPRNCCYFAYQRSGSYKHTMSDKELIASPGTILFINGEGSYTVNELCQGDAICAVIQIKNAPKSFLFDTQDDKSYAGLFNSLLLHSDTSVASNYYSSLGVLYELLGKIYKQKEKNYIVKGALAAVQKVHSYINNNYMNANLSMNELSAVGNTEIHRLNSLFKNEYGMTCWKYVMSVRIANAGNLLKAADYSINTIAELCGFTDAYYFSRAFKKVYGSSPNMFRKIELKKISD